MPDYKVTISDDQQIALDWMVTRFNASPPLDGDGNPITTTPELAIVGTVMDYLNNLFRLKIADEQTALEQKIAELSPEDRAAVLDAVNQIHETKASAATVFSSLSVKG